MQSKDFFLSVIISTVLFLPNVSLNCLFVSLNDGTINDGLFCRLLCLLNIFYRLNCDFQIFSAAKNFIRTHMALKIDFMMFTIFNFRFQNKHHSIYVDPWR